MKPITEQTPREIDTELARIYEANFDLFLKEQNTKAALETAERERRSYHLAAIPGYKATLERYAAQRRALAKEAEPLDAEFRRRGGWKRYYLVQGGHVHREMNCSTCYPTTRFGWLPQLSDCDESAMVAEHGDGACAVCFPEVQSHPAFLAARGRRLAAEAAEASKLCPKSGAYASSGGFRRYVRCECGVTVSVSKHGKFRKHMKPQPPKV